MRRRKIQQVPRKGMADVPTGAIQLSQCLPFFEVTGENPTAARWPGADLAAAILKANWSSLTATSKATVLPHEMDALKMLVCSMKSNVDDQENVQIPAAIRRLRDSADNFQGGR